MVGVDGREGTNTRTLSALTPLYTIFQREALRFRLVDLSRCDRPPITSREVLEGAFRHEMRFNLA